MKKVAGHLTTIAPALLYGLLPPSVPPSEPLEVAVDGGKYGPIRLTGRLHRSRSATSLVVLVHGLGGCADSAYLRKAAAAVHRTGCAGLRLSLRGADRSGQDIYHAGLTSDLKRVLRHPDVRSYDSIYLLGFSLGGHLVLKAALQDLSPAVKAVAAICPPINLEAVQQWIDAPARVVYRTYVLRNLKEVYREVANMGRAPTPVDEVESISTIRRWDEMTVVPRFGFDSVDAYYERESLGASLSEVKIPTLTVIARHDPMIPAFVPTNGRADNVGLLQLRTVDGGHVYLSDRLDLRLGTDGGVVEQIVGWFRRQE